MVLPSKPSIMARTQVHVCRNHQWPAHVAQEPTKAGSKGQKSKRKSPTAKQSKGSSDVQEPRMAGSSGLGGGDQMPQASSQGSQGIEAALSFLIAKVENLTGDMNDLKQQKARSFHAQSSSDKSRSRDQAGSQDTRPNRDSRS